MTRLTASSRLARAVCDLAIHPHGRMSYRVTPGFGAERRIDVVKAVARAIGYTVVDAPMPNNADVDVGQMGRHLSTDLSRAKGPTLILLFAADWNGSEAHRSILEGTVRMAREEWSINGETNLLIISPEDPVPLARLVGELLSDHDWTGSIPF